jgi:hypothetical protein
MVAEMHAEMTTQTGANADEVRQLAAKWSLKERESALKLFAELQALLASSGALVSDFVELLPLFTALYPCPYCRHHLHERRQPRQRHPEPGRARLGPTRLRNCGQTSR